MRAGLEYRFDIILQHVLDKLWCRLELGKGEYLYVACISILKVE